MRPEQAELLSTTPHGARTPHRVLFGGDGIGLTGTLKRRATSKKRLEVRPRVVTLKGSATGVGDHAPFTLYTTSLGRFYLGRSEDALELPELRRIRGKVKLILTSPPFPLNRKKAYGNLQGSTYLHWLASFAERLRELLSPTGSVVLELGNAWERGQPSFSILPMKALLAFQEAGRFHLCQEFICYNPAKLPTPAQWVTVERVRVKDAFTRVWWMSTTPRPDADNRRVLQPYSQDMQRLLERQTYNAGTRPSEHVIRADTFLTDHGGSIPSNVLTIANTSSQDHYLRYCRDHKLTPHPARMPLDLASFFVKFLTKPGDIVFDPFAGSNVTGLAAEQLKRRWIGIDSDPRYSLSSASRFPKAKHLVRIRISGRQGE